MDRAETQEEIFNLCETLFGKRDKLDFEGFQEVVNNESSEMFLSLMLLIQSSMPCSENFNRYKSNYNKFLTENPDKKSQAQGSDAARLIASPKLMSKLSPISRMMFGNSPSGSPQNINASLKNATLKNIASDEVPDEHVGEKNISDIVLTNMRKRQKEGRPKLELDNDDSVIGSAHGVRQSNALKKGGTVSETNMGQQAMSSPTSFLTSGACGSPRLGSFDLNEQD